MNPLGGSPEIMPAFAIFTFVSIVAPAHQEFPTREVGREGRLELLALRRAADPLALALAPGEREAWVVEGSELVRLDLTGEELGAGAERARLPLDVPPLDLCCTGDRLYVAGGDAGLWWVDLTADTPVAQRVVAPRGECTAVAASGGALLAAFTNAERSQLWIFDEEELQFTQQVALGPGTPFAIAARAGRAWIAMGAGGLWRVDYAGPAKPRVAAGPDTTRLPTPKGFQLEPGLVRDLALGDGHLYVAADSAGLLAIDLAQPWSADTPVAVQSVQRPGEVAYALRVAARGTRVAVGTLRGPARAAAGAPYGHFGAIGVDLAVGGIATSDYPRGKAERLLTFEHRPGGLQATGAAALPPCGWRTLELGAERVYAMHLVQGLVVRDVQKPGLPVVLERRRSGLPAIDGRFGLADPELVLFGVDSEGAVTGGLHRIEADGDVAPLEGTEDALTRTLTLGAHWLDPERGCEWILGGHGFTWRLHRIVPGDPPGYARWDVRPPPDADGRPGHTYFSSDLDGDRILLTRAHSRFGLLVASAEWLAGQASATEPGTPIDLEPLHVVATHPEGDWAQARAWRVKVTRLADGRRLALVAAGANTDPEGKDPDRARVLLFELPEDVREPPRILARLSGEATPGMAIAIESLALGERTLALAAGLSGQLNVFDVTRPEEAVRIATWTAPVNPFSGRPEPLLDLAVDEASATVFAAAGRVGLVRLDLTDPRAPRTVEITGTPGWCAGLCFDDRDGRARLAVGDQKGGLRVYAWIRPAAEVAKQE